MRASLKKIGLAAVMALTVAGTALITAGSAQAQHGHGHGYGGGGFGPGFVGGLAAGAVIGGGPYYGGGYYGGPYAYGGGPYAYGGGCYIERQVFINRFGHRVIRRVRVCD
jgi:hypothetical protein